MEQTNSKTEQNRIQWRRDKIFELSVKDLVRQRYHEC